MDYAGRTIQPKHVVVFNRNQYTTSIQMFCSGSKNEHLLEKTQHDSVTSYNTVSNNSTNIS
jgi:hypothetical protein